VTESNHHRRRIVTRNITLAREQVEISTRRLAREAKVNERQLRGWQAGDTEPSAPNLIKLGRVLGQSLEWFYEDHDDEPEAPSAA
jgi:transcriptional regulator with XRE-family HTH domain